MNRREILKSVMIIPFIGLGTAKIARGKSRTTAPKNKLFTGDPNWGSIITDQGWDAYIESIRAELERFIGMAAVACKDWVLSDFVRFWCGPHIFDISKSEYGANTIHGRREIPRIRWVDFIWSMNDNINYRIDFVQRFNPGYNPKDHKE